MVSLVATCGINLYPKRSPLSFVLISIHPQRLNRFFQLLMTLHLVSLMYSDIKTVPYPCYYSND